MLFSGSFYRSIVAKFFMLISISKRFLFIANSKTASTSLSKALRPYAEIERQGSPDRKHVSMGAVLDHYKFLFELPPFAPDTFFRFGVIRDPLDWIHSWYRYRQRAKGTRLIASTTTFEDFWRRRDWNIIKNGSPNLQIYKFTDKDFKPLVDYLIPYDQLAEHFQLICDTMGIETNLERLNTSHQRSSTQDIDENLKAEIVEFYARDYELISQTEDLNKAGLAHLKNTRS